MFGTKQNPQNQQNPPSEGNSSDDADRERDFQAKRSRRRLTEEEYVMVARDIMQKPPNSGYLKYHLPLRYAARCDEVRWVWKENGRYVYKELIGGGKNSDLEYD
jgi:hypothetical protein